MGDFKLIKPGNNIKGTATADEFGFNATSALADNVFSRDLHRVWLTGVYWLSVGSASFLSKIKSMIWMVSHVRFGHINIWNDSGDSKEKENLIYFEIFPVEMCLIKP